MIYTQKKGNIEEIDPEGHNAVLKIPGQADQKFTIPDGVAYEEEFVLPVGQITKPGVYAAQIIVKDKHCEQTLPPFPVDFTVNYPSDIFKYKFNNVLAVYNKGYGGNSGYEFTAYQWYRNGKEVDGATESVLYLGQGVTFDEGDEVFVMLTDNSGMTLPSCPQVIDNVPNYNGQSNQAPATKHLENRQIIIRQGDKTYNVYGQRVR